jgi:hypothetical protein
MPAPLSLPEVVLSPVAAIAATHFRPLLSLTQNPEAQLLRRQKFPQGFSILRPADIEGATLAQYSPVDKTPEPVLSSPSLRCIFCTVAKTFSPFSPVYTAANKSVAFVQVVFGSGHTQR